MKLKAALTGSRIATATAALGLFLFAVAANAAGPGPAWLDEPLQGAYDLTGTLAVTNPGDLRAVLLFDNESGKPEGDQYKLIVTAKGAQFYRIKGGKAITLGWSDTAGVKASKEPMTFTLQRRDWVMSFILDNRVIARAYDAELTKGKAGSVAAGGQWDDLRAQPVGDILLRDDFVRDTGEQSVWETVQGTWAQQTLREDPQATRMEADKSTNAFCYLGKNPTGRAISVGGYWFWDGYTFKVAVRPEGDGAVGLVFYYQDEKNYMAIRWTSRNATAKDADQLQLIQVLDGKETILASDAGGFNAQQWYALRVNACEDLIQCFVDDEVRLQKRTNMLGQGQVGFLAEGGSGAFFDDAEARNWEVFSDDLSAACPGKWSTAFGNWQFGVNQVARATGNTEGLCTGGRSAWRNYATSVDVKSGGGQGMAFAVRPEGYFVFRVAPKGSKAAYAGKAQILKVAGKTRSVIAEGEAGLSGSDWHRVKIETEDGYITGYLDDKPLVRAFDQQSSAGCIGLYADGQAAFKRAYLALLPPKTSAHVTKEFTDTSAHPEMAEWASTAAPWVKPATETPEAVWWTKGDYYGDQSVQFAIPAPGSKTGTLTAVLCADPAVKDSGYVLTIAATAGSKVLKAKITAGGKELGAADVTAAGDPCPVVYEHRNGFVVLEVDGKVALTCKG